MKICTAKRRGGGARKWPRNRDSGRWARLGSEFGVRELKRYEKYGGARLLMLTDSMEGQAGATRRGGQGKRTESGRRKEWSPAGTRRWSA